MAKLDVNIWMPLYIGDFLRDTAGLDTEMIGAVILLYLRIWSKGGPLPDSNEKLARVCQMSANRFAEIREEISFLFDIRDGNWTHDDLLAERAKWLQARKNKSEANRKNANKRWHGAEVIPKDEPGLPDDAY